MKFCSQCGTQVSEQDTFCSSCGNKLEAAAAQSFGASPAEPQKQTVYEAADTASQNSYDRANSDISTAGEPPKYQPFVQPSSEPPKYQPFAPAGSEPPKYQPFYGSEYSEPQSVQASQGTKVKSLLSFIFGIVSLGLAALGILNGFFALFGLGIAIAGKILGSKQLQLGGADQKAHTGNKLSLVGIIVNPITFVIWLIVIIALAA